MKERSESLQCTPTAAQGRSTPPRILRALLLQSIVLTACVFATASAQADHVTTRPLSRGEADEILLISTRPVGLRCDPALMPQGLHGELLACDEYGASSWQTRSWDEISAILDEPLPTIIFIHGNRVASGEDKAEGLSLYRAIAARRQSEEPFRFIIWSWPSAQIPGPMKDYQVKAARTKYVSWQLAWAIDQLSPETPLSLVGYSYGARITTGALHLLAGGRLGQLHLAERIHPNRPPVRAALVAAAVDADWIRPGGYHGLALQQVDELLLVNNHLDPAMRFYHMVFEGRVRPLGYAGLPGRHNLGQFTTQIRSVNVTSAVGRHHALEEYLAASGPVGQVLAQVTQFPTPDVPAQQSGGNLAHK